MLFQSSSSWRLFWKLDQNHRCVILSIKICLYSNRSSAITQWELCLVTNVHTLNYPLPEPAVLELQTTDVERIKPWRHLVVLSWKRPVILSPALLYVTLRHQEVNWNHDDDDDDDMAEYTDTRECFKEQIISPPPPQNVVIKNAHACTVYGLFLLMNVVFRGVALDVSSLLPSGSGCNVNSSLSKEGG